MGKLPLITLLLILGMTMGQLAAAAPNQDAPGQEGPNPPPGPGNGKDEQPAVRMYVKQRPAPKKLIVKEREKVADTKLPIKAVLWEPERTKNFVTELKDVVKRPQKIKSKPVKVLDTYLPAEGPRENSGSCSGGDSSINPIKIKRKRGYNFLKSIKPVSKGDSSCESSGSNSGPWKGKHRKGCKGWDHWGGCDGWDGWDGCDGWGGGCGGLGGGFGGLSGGLGGGFGGGLGGGFGGLGGGFGGLGGGCGGLGDGFDGWDGCGGCGGLDGWGGWGGLDGWGGCGGLDGWGGGWGGFDGWGGCSGSMSRESGSSENCRSDSGGWSGRISGSCSGGISGSHSGRRTSIGRPAVLKKFPPVRPKVEKDYFKINRPVVTRKTSKIPIVKVDLNPEESSSDSSDREAIITKNAVVRNPVAQVKTESP